MPDGGTLTLRGYVKQGRVCLDVADTGDGIPEGVRVLESSSSTKPGGTGLGLVIVREIVQQHNGSIFYTTERGKGTTFQLSFPIPRGSEGV